jgi:membrane protease YdiL (CAAX protease family)
MPPLLRDSHGRLRNGWWIVLFIAVFLLSRLPYHPLSTALQSCGFDGAWLAPLPALFVLLVTWICMRVRRQPLAAVGLALGTRWMRHALFGTVFGGITMAVVAACIAAAGGVRFHLDPAHGLTALAIGAWSFAGVALFEELLFRGFVFQRLVDGAGPLIAQVSMAILFAVAHWDNPGMEGATQAWATLDTALGAILLGLAFLRTGSLALPIGIHFGWNWMQGSVLGFDVSGIGQAGWLSPELLDKPQWLSGGTFGPEASVFAVLVDIVSIALLWRWKGTTAQSLEHATPAPGGPPAA